MAIYDFFLSRNGAASTPENYVGHTGRLFYDSATGEIRISDGSTPGGNPIPVTIATTTTAGVVKPGLGFTVDAGGALTLNAGPMFALDGSDVFQLLPATETRIGGVKAGSGVAINPDGTILIDSEGLEFTFGDFSGTVGTYTDLTDYALLQSLNADEDIVIATNGTGHVNMVGEFNVYATNADVTDAIEGFEPILRVLADGKVRMIVPAADTLAGAFEIIGNSTGYAHPTNQTGVILHTTGQVDTVNRVYHDAVNNYPIIVGRRYNGTAGALENVKSGDVIFRIAGQASTGTDFETFGPAKINWMATEDQGPNNQGGKITIDVTANGTAAFGNAITAAEFTATGVVSTVGFVGDLTGNADTVTNGVYTSDTGTVTNTMLAGSIANNKLANSTISGVALGSDLAALSAGNYLTGTDYTGATARTFAVDATTTATASKVVARDANGDIAATGTILATRDAGSFGAGQTITIDMATDHYVHATVTSATVTVAYTNITAGKQVMIFFTNSTGADIAVNSGLATTNCTNAKAVENTKNGGTSRFGAVSFGTSTATMYGNWEK
jgi:hypothetical protein